MPRISLNLSDLRLLTRSPRPTMLPLGTVVSVLRHAWNVAALSCVLSLGRPQKHVLLCLPRWRGRLRSECTAAMAPLAHGERVARAGSATHATNPQLRMSSS